MKKTFNTDHTQTKFEKLEDEVTGERYLSLDLPNGCRYPRVSKALGQYLHEQEQKVMLLNKEVSDLKKQLK